MFKKNQILMLSVLFIFSSAFASEETVLNSNSVQKTSMLNESQNKVHLGFLMQSLTYREPDIDVTDTGRLTGIEASMSRSLSSDYLLRGQMQFLTGNLKYDGHLMNANTAFESNNDYKIREFKIDAEAKVNTSQENSVFIYAGVGRKETLQSRRSSAKSDYSRDLIYNFYSLGLQGDLLTKGQTILSVDASLETLFAGRIYSHLSEISSQYNDTDYSIKSGHSVGLDLTMQYKFTLIDVLTAKIGVRYWSTEPAQVANPTPQNVDYLNQRNTTQLTTLGVGYLF